MTAAVSPVSYTHLDVYKRQMLILAIERRGIAVASRQATIEIIAASTIAITGTATSCKASVCACLLYTSVHPVIAGFVEMVPQMVGFVLMCILYACYAADVVVTAFAASDLALSLIHICLCRMAGPAATQDHHRFPLQAPAVLPQQKG